MSIPLALYLHIPFCAVRCAYCDFNTYAGLERLYEPYAAALIREIRRRGAERGRPAVRTIFIGGGTPTVLPPTLLADVLDACREAFDVAADAEITSEANPGTVDQAHFAALAAMGVNRLSMGVQSFDDAELAGWAASTAPPRLRRPSTPRDEPASPTSTSISSSACPARSRPPGRAPWRGRSTWRRSTSRSTVSPWSPAPPSSSRRAAARSPSRTTTWPPICTRRRATRWLRAGMSSMRFRIGRGLRDQGSGSAGGRWQTLPPQSPHLLAASPASSFQLPVFQCRHNLVYWRNEPYLGFGAGAHSFAEERRWWNVKPVPEYIRRIADGRSPEREGEIIDRRLAMGETMMLGLRLVQEGVDGRPLPGPFRRRAG